METTSQELSNCKHIKQNETINDEAGLGFVWIIAGSHPPKEIRTSCFTLILFISAEPD